MIIKLTNTIKEYEGKTFLLNTDVIISVYEGVSKEGIPGTFVYGQNDNTWQVKETVEQIFEMLS